MSYSVRFYISLFALSFLLGCVNQFFKESVDLPHQNRPISEIREIDNDIVEKMDEAEIESNEEKLKQGNFQEVIESFTMPPAGMCYIDRELVEKKVFEDIFDHHVQGCGYKLRGFTKSEIYNLCANINNLCEGKPTTCHVSNCTTASYMGIIRLLQLREDWPEMKDQFSCKPPRGFSKGYATYTKPDGLRKLFKNFGLGKTKRVLNRDFAALEIVNWPKKGDPVLLQRGKKYKYSAHSAIFSHYEKDANGKIVRVCFWSSNRSTKGSGQKCENTNRLDFIDVAKVDNV